MHLLEVDKGVILKAREGDKESWEDIYRVYSPVVYNISYRITGSLDDAGEVTREVFVNIFSSLRKFDIESSGFGMWVYKIAVNMSLSQLSAIKKLLDKIFSFEIPGGSEEDIAAVHPDNEDDKSRAQNESANRKLMQLSPKLRAVLVLREMEALSYEEIAKTLNISEHKVKSNIKKARYKFMQQGASQ